MEKCQTEWLEGKQKQEAIYVSVDVGTAPTPCHVLAHFSAQTPC